MRSKTNGWNWTENNIKTCDFWCYIRTKYDGSSLLMLTLTNKFIKLLQEFSGDLAPQWSLLPMSAHIYNDFMFLWRFGYMYRLSPSLALLIFVVTIFHSCSPFNWWESDMLARSHRHATSPVVIDKTTYFASAATKPHIRRLMNYN
jgi:hypothetical protein